MDRFMLARRKVRNCNTVSHIKRVLRDVIIFLYSCI